MLKKLSVKKRSKNIESDNENIQQQKVYDYSSWIKRHFIVVPNHTTPNNLTEYQKLIVLRTPGGEKRVVVDFSLTDSETDRLHLESLENDAVNLFDQSITRIIPTNINTKEIDYYNDLSKKEIEQINLSLEESAKEFVSFASLEVKEKEQLIFRMNDSNIRILNDYSFKPSKNIEYDFNEVDDIDSVVIKTDEQVDIRENWHSVDDYIKDIEEVESRKEERFSFDINDPLQYIPSEQPIFRSFVDADLLDISKYGDYDEELPSSNFSSRSNFDDTSIMDVENISTSQPDRLSVENEDPEIIVDSIKTTNMSDYIDSSIQDDENEFQSENDEQETKSVEDNTVLSFFKNKVTVPSTHNVSGGQHIQKHIKFYKSSKNYKYEKVILNKKKNMYTYRKVLVK